MLNYTALILLFFTVWCSSTQHVSSSTETVYD